LVGASLANMTKARSIERAFAVRARNPVPGSC
jgi:hypothetical protein